MSDSRRTQLLPYAALGVGILSLGFSGIFVRWAHAPGVVTSFYRMAIAVVLMALPFTRRRSAGGIPAAGLRYALFGGVFFAGDVALWATGVMLGGATNPTLLANTAPLWVGLGALLIFREQLSAAFWAGLLLAMAGAATVLGLDTLRATTFGLGSLLGLLAAAFYGGYFLLTQRGRETLDSMTYFWLAAFSSSIVLLLLCLLLRLPLLGYDSRTYLNFLGLGVITQTLGYLAITYAIGHLPASLVAPTLLGQPVVTALLARPLLAEQLSGGHLVGGIAVLAGVYIVHRSRQRPAVAA